MLKQLNYLVKTWKISDRLYEEWKNDPQSVTNHVGAIISEDIQRIEMSGPAGEPKRDLEAMVNCYNTGKTTTTTSIASTVNQAKPRPNFYTPRTNSSTSANTSGNSSDNNSGRGGRLGNSGANRQQNTFCNYCRMIGSHYKAKCYSKKNDIKNGRYKDGDNSRCNGGNNQRGVNKGRGGTRGGGNKGRAFAAQNQEAGQDYEGHVVDLWGPRTFGGLGTFRGPGTLRGPRILGGP
jgi:hypothetical protein